MSVLRASGPILVTAGSTRVASFNRRLARLAADALLARGVDVTYVELSDYPLPLYEGDLEAAGIPPHAKQLRELLQRHPNWLLVSPEHNGSVPALLKNVIDWTSRTIDGEDFRALFSGRRVALMSASPGRNGGARGLVHLRQILAYLGANVLEEQFTLGRTFEVFTEQGLQAPHDAALGSFLDTVVAAIGHDAATEEARAG
jgi:chromate reductase